MTFFVAQSVLIAILVKVHVIHDDPEWHTYNADRVAASLQGKAARGFTVQLRGL